jgi:hypothetical protein
MQRNSSVDRLDHLQRMGAETDNGKNHEHSQHSDTNQPLHRALGLTLYRLAVIRISPFNALACYRISRSGAVLRLCRVLSAVTAPAGSLAPFRQAVVCRAASSNILHYSQRQHG